VHPQQWPQDLDLSASASSSSGRVDGLDADPGDRLGGGARDDAAALPSYFLAPPLTHELAVTLRALDVPEDWTHEILRRAYAAQFNELARMSHEAPDELHAFLMESLTPLLPEGFDVDKHFTPRYRPWQQRIAIVPEGDLFAALREGKASIVTDTIETFTETGIRVSSGEELEATSSSAPRGSTCRCSETSPSASTASRSTFPSRVTWRGIMISGSRTWPTSSATSATAGRCAPTSSATS
jgi:hypothetical protein